jgi:putative membrane protein
MTRHYTRAALLGGFALLIAKLFLANEMVKYMSPSLDPLTALTGALLALMAVMELRAARAPGPLAEEHRADATEQALTGLMLALPLALGFLIAPRALGTSALGGENVADLLLSFGTGPAPALRSTSSPSPPPPAAPIEDVPDLLAYLRQTGELGLGQRVRVAGLVARSPSLAPDELALLRYSIAHCVADARPLGLLVVTPDDRGWAADQWVRIEGTLARRERDGDRLVSIAAETIVPIDEPGNPYLTSGQ